MRTDNIRETGHIKRKERILFSDMDGTLLRTTVPYLRIPKRSWTA